MHTRSIVISKVRLQDYNKVIKSPCLPFDGRRPKTSYWYFEQTHTQSHSQSHTHMHTHMHTHTHTHASVHNT